MRLPIIALLIVTAAASVKAQSARSGQATEPRLPEIVVTAARVDRFARWLKAVDRHEPGTIDAAVHDLATGPAPDLRALWADAKFLAALMRNLKLNRFAIADGRGTVPIVYSPVLLQRMRAMACAAAGRLASRECLAIHAIESLDGELRHLGEHAADARQRSGEDNDILRRAALLHTDVEILKRPSSDSTDGGATLPGPQQMRANTTDGVPLSVGEVGIHWEVARTALDAVKPKGADRPERGRDPMVRDWYRATSAWMQHVEYHDLHHIDRGRE